MHYTLITKELINKLNAPKDLRFRQWNESLDKQINTHKLLGGNVLRIDSDAVALIDSNSIDIISKRKFMLDNNPEIYLMGETLFKSIDISEIELATDIDYSNLFYECKASKIYIGNIKNNHGTFYGTFKRCCAEIFGLETLDFSTVHNTCVMFISWQSNKKFSNRG